MIKISLEGYPGAGKSTMAQMLKDYYTQRGKLVNIHKPIRRAKLSSIAQAFEKKHEPVWTMELPTIPFDAELFAYWSILIFEKSLVNQGSDIIIFDRYIDTISSLVFSRAKLYFNEIEFEKYVTLLKNNFYPYILMPDITFLFDIDIKVASERTYNREKKSYNSHDAILFTEMQQFQMKLAKTENRFLIINSGQSIEETFGSIVSQINQY